MEPLELLADLIRIDTTNPPGGEAPAAELLESQLSAGGLDTEIVTSPGGRANLLARIPGPTDVPALVLVSHTDVVPAERDRWARDPFCGDVVDGELWGRGALDMKGVAVMHAHAALALAGSGRTPSREVIVAAVADEEALGGEGAAWLVDAHPERLGFRDGAPPPEALGEGGYGLSGLLDRPLMPIIVGEKQGVWIKARATGAAGHGSLPPDEQALRDLAAFVTAVAGTHRPRVHPVMREQFATLTASVGRPTATLLRLLASAAGGPAVRVLGDALRKRSGAMGHLLADTVTPTELHAGYKTNVVPAEATATFDARVLPDQDIDEFVGRLARRAGPGITVQVQGRAAAPVSDEGPLSAILRDVSEALPSGPICVPSLTPALTDLRFLRQRGALAYGWVPVVLTPELLAGVHGADERVPVDGFREGVEAMTEVVLRAAGAPA